MRVLSVFTLIVFIGAGLAPLAYSYERLHWCEHSKGPCQHGEACPVRHGAGNKAKDERGSERDHEGDAHNNAGRDKSGHNKNPHSKGGCDTFIGCTSSDGPPLLVSAQLTPYLTTGAALSIFDTCEALLESHAAFYAAPVPAPPERPPAFK